MIGIKYSNRIYPLTCLTFVHHKSKRINILFIFLNYDRKHPLFLSSCLLMASSTVDSSVSDLFSSAPALQSNLEILSPDQVCVDMFCVATCYYFHCDSYAADLVRFADRIGQDPVGEWSESSLPALV